MINGETSLVETAVRLTQSTYKGAPKNVRFHPRDCLLCGTDQELTVHHLRPAVGGMPKIEGEGLTCVLCRPCHDQVHRMFTNHSLRFIYNTPAKLVAGIEQRDRRTFWRNDELA